MMPRKPDPAAAVMRGIQTPKTSIPENTPNNYIKFATSLFPADIEAIRTLEERMRRHATGVVTRADAVKIALRFAAAVMTDEQIQEQFSAIKQEDRRRTTL